MTFFAISDPLRPWLGRPMRMVPEVPNPLAAFQGGLEEDGLYRFMDDRHVMVMAHADADAVARPHLHSLAPDDHPRPAFEKDPIFVAVVVMGIDTRLLRVVYRVAVVRHALLARHPEDAAARDILAPAAAESRELGCRRT